MILTVDVLVFGLDEQSYLSMFGATFDIIHDNLFIIKGKTEYLADELLSVGVMLEVNHHFE